MKNLNEEQLQKIINNTASERELASFDEVFLSENEIRPSLNFTENVIQKFKISNVKFSKKALPPYFAGVFLVLVLSIYFIAGSISGNNLSFEQSEISKYLNTIHINSSLLMNGLVFSNIILAMLVIDRVLLAQLLRKNHRI